MFASRFSFPDGPVDAEILKNSYRLKLDLLCFRGGDAEGDPPGTIEAGYTIEGQVTIKPGDDDRFLSQLVAAFRTAQRAKGGCDECNS